MIGDLPRSCKDCIRLTTVDTQAAVQACQLKHEFRYLAAAGSGLHGALGLSPKPSELPSAPQHGRMSPCPDPRALAAPYSAPWEHKWPLGSLTPVPHFMEEKTEAWRGAAIAPSHCHEASQRLGQKWNQAPAWAFLKGELARGPADKEEIIIFAAETEARARKCSLTPWASSRPQGMMPTILPPR